MLFLFWGATKILFSSVPPHTDEETVRSAQRAEILIKVTKQADADLNRYAMKDAGNGTVQLPVARAMELQVQAFQKNPAVRPAYLIDPAAAAAEAEALAGKPATPATTTPPSSK